MRRQRGEKKQPKQREKQKQTEQVRTWKHTGGNREKDDWEVRWMKLAESALVKWVTSAESDGGYTLTSNI